MFHVKPTHSMIQQIPHMYLISIMFHVKPIIKTIFVIRPRSTFSGTSKRFIYITSLELTGI